MPTTITKTVKSAGGDYTSLSAWEAGQQADLPTADQIQVAECYAFQDTTSVIINGWTTDATRYIVITVPIAQRHAGIRSTTQYNLRTSTSFGNALSCAEDFLRIQGLQIKNVGASSPIGLRLDGAAGSDHRVFDTLIYDNTGTNGDACFVATTITPIFLNCVFMNNTRDGLSIGAGGGQTGYCYNCVSVNNGSDGFTVAAFQVLNSKNCYAGGNGGNDFDTPVNATHNKTTCHSEDATGNTTTAFSTSSGAFFTNVTAGSEDVHIGSSSALKDAGTDLSGDAKWVHPDGNVDFEATARVAPWDVGADEFVGLTTEYVGPVAMQMQGGKMIGLRYV